jgi:DNA-binding winged helix-turn-helix (wHTH) protein/TolB-like protein/Tfp pilus assembly protein PilF
MMTGKEQDITFEFGPFRLNARERRLLYDSEPVLLTPKAFDTLTALVERSGHVVGKDELMQIVWPDSFVEESGLTRNISVLRKELDRTPGGKDYIETVPKVGYRFTPAVTKRAEPAVFALRDSVQSETLENGVRTSAPAPKHLSRRLSVIAAGLLLLGLGIGIAYRYRFGANVNSVADPSQSQNLAVLPFRPMVAGTQDENLQIGIADALISKLSNLRQLTLKPTSAVRRYVGPAVDPQSAGRELGVDVVVDGSIQRDGERVIVSVQLVRVGDGASIWAQRFEDRATDMFKIQDAISERIVSALRIKLDADEQARLFRHYTENVQAFDAYSRGRNLLSQYTRESTLAALEAFEEALRYDPNYALARDGLATGSAEMFLRFANENESAAWSARADEEIAKALQLDPGLAETHQALAAVYRKKDFNWDRVLDESSRALELNPSLEQAHYYRAAAFYHLGLLDAALQETELAEKINPQNRIDSLRTRGVIALYDGRYAEAIASFEEVQRLSSKPIADSHLALAYYYHGDEKRAEQLARSLGAESSVSASTRARASLASFLAAKNISGEAEKLLKELEARESVDHHAAYSIGAAYTQLHNNDKALYWLRRASSTGLSCFPLFEKDKLLDPLRARADFKTFLNELQEAGNSARQRYAK